MNKITARINVTKPNLPSIERIYPYLEKIWSNKILTNNGPIHQLFEEELSRFLDVKHVSLFNNATLALIVSLQALKLTGEVITTPFSFVATSHALKWNGLTPVFCDIDERTLCLDADRIEPLITSATTGIMPVHVYGRPCNVDKIRDIADRYGLKVIYDAAHAFNVKLNNETILTHGDISVLSFHATKLFNTFEGGATIARDKNLKREIDILKNFGFTDEITVVAPGINAKMNEFQAAIGLLGLEIVNQEIAARKTIAESYRNKLFDMKGIRLFMDTPGDEHNYAYFPILIDSEAYGLSRDQVYDKLKMHNVFSRRYFYPLISNFAPYCNLPTSSKENLPIANRIAEQVLCLPIYGALELSQVDLICQLITGFGK